MSDLPNHYSSNTPEKKLWLAVLEQMISDFQVALGRACYNECEALLRCLQSEHCKWLCDVCEIHPSRIEKYMREELRIKRIHKPQNKIEIKQIKNY